MADSPDVIRKRFSDELEAAREPRLEEFLDHVTLSERVWLFRDCVEMELRHCRTHGVRFDVDVMKQRFPQFSHILDEVCQSYADSEIGTYESTVALKRRKADPPADSVGLPPPPPQTGRYQLERLVGRGAFGEVWRARDPQLNRIVAVKLPRGDRHFTSEQLESFLSEARCVANLRIPGVVPVFDVGEQGDSSYYIVTDFVDGETLAERIRREKYGWHETAALVAEIADTLHRAHLKDLVHRDIKPSNILLDREGRPYVADFGLAVSEQEQLRERAAVLGTLAYMSPEQARGDSNRVDARADVYGLGVILYQLLTKRLPFLGASFEEYQKQILSREARPPRTIDDSIPIELERICLKCLSKSITDRYSTAKDLATDLREWLKSTSTSTTPAVPAPPSQSRMVMSIVAGAVVIASAVFVGMKLSDREPSMREAKEPPVNLASIQDAHRNLVSPERSNANDTVDRERSSDQGERPLSLLEKTWQAELGRLPLEIRWPGYKSGGTHGFRDDLNGYEVISDPIRFIQLGTFEQPSGRFGITIEQPTWSGDVGVFLGYRTVDTEMGTVGQSQWIYGSIYKPPDGRPVYRVRRAIALISDGYMKPSYELGFVDVPFPAGGANIRVELDFREGRLIHSSWDGKMLPFNTEFANERTTVNDFVGPWGVMSYHATSWFRDPTFTPREGPLDEQTEKTEER